MPVAKILIESGANINHREATDTPLVLRAVDADSVALMQLLIDHKVDLQARDQYGLSAYVYALKRGNSEVVKLIKDAGGKY